MANKHDESAITGYASCRKFLEDTVMDTPLPQAASTAERPNRLSDTEKAVIENIPTEISGLDHLSKCMDELQLLREQLNENSFTPLEDASASDASLQILNVNEMEDFCCADQLDSSEILRFDQLQRDFSMREGTSRLLSMDASLGSMFKNQELAEVCAKRDAAIQELLKVREQQMNMQHNVSSCSAASAIMSDFSQVIEEIPIEVPTDVTTCDKELQKSKIDSADVLRSLEKQEENKQYSYAAGELVKPITLYRNPFSDEGNSIVSDQMDLQELVEEDAFNGNLEEEDIKTRLEKDEIECRNKYAIVPVSAENQLNLTARSTANAAERSNLEDEREISLSSYFIKRTCPIGSLTVDSCEKPDFGLSADTPVRTHKTGALVDITVVHETSPEINISVQDKDEDKENSYIPISSMNETNTNALGDILDSRESILSLTAITNILNAHEGTPRTMAENVMKFHNEKEPTKKSRRSRNLLDEMDKNDSGMSNNSLGDNSSELRRSTFSVDKSLIETKSSKETTEKGNRVLRDGSNALNKMHFGSEDLFIRHGGLRSVQHKDSLSKDVEAIVSKQRQKKISLSSNTGIDSYTVDDTFSSNGSGSGGTSRLYNKNDSGIDSSGKSDSMVSYVKEQVLAGNYSALNLLKKDQKEQEPSQSSVCSTGQNSAGNQLSWSFLEEHIIPSLQKEFSSNAEKDTFDRVRSEGTLNQVPEKEYSESANVSLDSVKDSHAEKFQKVSTLNELPSQSDAGRGCLSDPGDLVAYSVNSEPAVDMKTSRRVQSEMNLPFIDGNKAMWISVESVIKCHPQCTGVGTSIVVPIRNISDKYLHCEFSVVDILWNRHDVSLDAESPVQLQAPSKLILHPQKLHEAKMVILPYVAGTFSLLLEVVVSTIGTLKSSVQKVSVCIQCLAEAPQIMILEYSSVLDFGLLPEGCRKTLPLTIVNLGESTIPLRLTIQQVPSAVQAFRFGNVMKVGSEEQQAILESPTFLVWELEGKGSGNHVIQVEVQFHTPNISDSIVDASTYQLKLNSILSVQLDIPEANCILKQCSLEGSVAKLGLEIAQSKDPLCIYASRGGFGVEKLHIYNSGALNLELVVNVLYPDGNGTEDAISATPSHLLLIPREEREINIAFHPSPSTNVTEGEIQISVQPGGPSFCVNVKGVVERSSVVMHSSGYDCNLRSVSPNSVISETGSVQGIATRSPYSRSELSEKGGVPQRRKRALESTKLYFSWGSVELNKGKSERCKFRNATSENLTLQAEIRQNTDFRIERGGSKVHKCTIEIPGNSTQEFRVSFCPSKVGAAIGMVSIKTTNLPRNEKFVIRLCGYGGHGKIKMKNVSKDEKGNMWLNLGDVDSSSTLERCFLVQNIGTLPAFVKIFSEPKEINVLKAVNRTTITVIPDQFVLDGSSSKEVTVVYYTENSELKTTAASEVQEVGTLFLTSGDEISRLRLRRIADKQGQKNLKKELDLQHVYLHSHFPGEKAHPELEGFIDTGKDFEMLSSGFSKMVVTLVVEKINEEQESTIDPSSATFLPLEEGDTTIMSATCVTDTTLRPVSSCSHADSESSRSGELLRVRPMHLELLRRNNFSNFLEINSRCDVPQTFEVKCDSEFLTVEPIEGYLAARGHAIVRISVPTNLAAQMCQWEGSVQIYTENDVKTVKVKVDAIDRNNVLQHDNQPRHTTATRFPPSILYKAPAAVLSEPTFQTPRRPDTEIMPENPRSYQKPSYSRVSIPREEKAESNLSLYSDTYEVTFSAKLGEAAAHKVVVKNRSRHAEKVEVLPLGEPFSVRVKDLIVASRSYTSFKVFFKPTMPGKYRNVLVLNVNGKPMLHYSLFGECV